MRRRKHEDPEPMGVVVMGRVLDAALLLLLATLMTFTLVAAAGAAHDDSSVHASARWSHTLTWYDLDGNMRADGGIYYSDELNIATPVRPVAFPPWWNDLLRFSEQVSQPIPPPLTWRWATEWEMRYPLGTLLRLRNIQTGGDIWAQVTDTCPGCGWWGLDVSPVVFEAVCQCSAEQRVQQGITTALVTVIAGMP